MRIATHAIRALLALACLAAFAPTIAAPVANAPAPAAPVATPADAPVPAPRIVKAHGWEGQLTLEFDQPMLTWNGRTDVDALRIAPDAACQWFWQDDTSLICRGNFFNQHPFRSASEYRVSIGHGLWSQAGVELAPTQAIVRTALPQLDARIGQWLSGIPGMFIQAPADTTATTVANVLGVTLDGHAIAFDLATPNKAELQGTYFTKDDHVFALRLHDLGGRAGVLRVHVRPGLVGSDGPLPGDQDKDLLTARIGEAFGLRGVDCGNLSFSADPGHRVPAQCPPDQDIVLRFSRALNAAALTQLRAALPTDLSLREASNCNHYHGDRDTAQSAPDVNVCLRASVAGRTLALRLPAGLSADDGGTLAGATTIALRLGDWPPAFTMKPELLILPPGSPTQPDVRATNIAGAPDVQQMAIGADVTTQATRLQAGGARNVPTPVALPTTPDAIRANGGLLLVGEPGPVQQGADYALAYAPFAVLVGATGDGQRLVWVSSWDGGHGLAQAQVELLRVTASGKATVLTHASTAADGVAVLDAIPDDDSQQNEAGALLVRATYQGQRTVVPVTGWSRWGGPHTLFAHDAHGIGDPGTFYQSRWPEGELRAFGVTDRPLYRPGETVHYRFWQRQRQGNRLLPPTQRQVTAVLRAPDDNKRLATWPVTLDALASASGQTTLPELLPDSDYCITTAQARLSDTVDDESGACFKVARFDAQPLWAQMQADHPAVLGGQALALDVQAGYYSGDDAANVNLRVEGLLTPRRIQDSYPAYAAYTFIAPYSGEDSRPFAEPLQGVTVPHTTDGQGRAHIGLHLPAIMQSSEDKPHPIAFGLLEFTASVNVSNKASASSGTLAVRYAQYPRYVGLKTAGWWLPIDADAGLAAVVLSADGHEVPGQSVHVQIAAIADAQGRPEVTPKAVGSCELRTDAPTACAFRAPAPGLYRFSASAEGAAPTELTRWIGGHAPVSADQHGPTASLTLLTPSDGVSAARVQLTQPHAHANVLFTLQSGRILTHWVQAVSGEKTQIVVPLRADWRPGATLQALVRDADGGFGSRTLEASLDLAIPAQRHDAITVKLERTRLRPGQELLLHLANPSTGPAHATIAVVDDSVYQQVLDTAAQADPEQDGWLGALNHWYSADWFALEDLRSLPTPFAGLPLSGWRKAMDAAAKAREEEERKREARRVAQSGTNAVGLERVEVVGSRIRRGVDTFSREPTAAVLKRGPHADPGTVQGRLRDRFLDSAYWNPDLTLAAGERRDLRIRLPDNLTRWRVLVWSSDAGDGFALTQATVETALPVELRAGLPSRVFVGDAASGSVSARNHGSAAATLALQVSAQGAGVAQRRERRVGVAGNAEVSQTIALAPTRSGDIAVQATATRQGAADGLASAVPVLTRDGDAQTVQAGWLDASTIDLPLPQLPTGAHDATLDVQVDRGLDGWQDGWIADLRDYPMRCWEQTLSRALGAALAIAAHKDGTLWPKAADEVRDALRVAPMFLDDGQFHYFPSSNGGWQTPGSPALSAYTLRAFKVLAELGHPAPAPTVDSLQASVAATIKRAASLKPDDRKARTTREEAAEAAGALDDPKLLDAAALDALWNAWPDLSWYGRSQLLRALAQQPAQAAHLHEGIARLRAAGSAHGLRRVIHDGRDFGWAMGSDLRDQCAVVGTLYELDHDAAGEAARLSLLRGLQDLYAGGVASLDTQATAQCLLALQSVVKRLPHDGAAAQVAASLGTLTHRFTLATGQAQAQWTQPLPASDSTANLRLQTQTPDNASLNYSARLRYRVDLANTPAQAVGMRLTRSYQVLRGGRFVDPGEQPIRSGDWVRVRLLLDVPAFRHFVAITDTVPGGLVTRDIGLSQVGGADLKHVADPGSWWFDSRQTGANIVHLYAQRLPPGSHEVYYYAQAVQPGDYFAPPAVAELMYGRASRATTPADHVQIAPTADAKQTPRRRNRR
ncbi:MAG: hypothetical protein JSR63_11580 [Proteobacteria bacterium]|nr:hypothetical protein [Pseudomonadota bacterium]